MNLPATNVRWHATSIGSVVLYVGGGILLLAAAYGLLFWNEGRINNAILAQEATSLNAAKISTDPALQGDLVAVTGEVSLDDLIGDNLFLEPGEYISINRVVEKYVGDEWASMNMAPLEDFLVEDAGFAAESVNVGAYTVATSGLNLPRYERVTLTNANTDLSGGATIDNNYIFLGSGTNDAPQEGDTRVAYSAVGGEFTGTVLGQLKNGAILPYEGEEEELIFALYDGSRDDALQALATENATRTWVLRIVGAIIYWVAMTGILFITARMYGLIRPMTIFITRFLLGVAAIPAAIATAAVTFLSASWFHSGLLSFILTFAVVAALGAWWLRYVRARQDRTIIPGR